MVAVSLLLHADSDEITVGKTRPILVTSFNHWTMHNKLNFVHASWSFRIPFAFHPLSSVQNGDLVLENLTETQKGEECLMVQFKNISYLILNYFVFE